MLFFVPEATFAQEFIMYSFFIGTPVLLFTLIGFLGYKSVKQSRYSKKCANCAELIDKDAVECKFCKENL